MFCLWLLILTRKVIGRECSLTFITRVCIFPSNDSLHRIFSMLHHSHQVDAQWTKIGKQKKSCLCTANNQFKCLQTNLGSFYKKSSFNKNYIKPPACRKKNNMLNVYRCYKKIIKTEQVKPGMKCANCSGNYTANLRSLPVALRSASSTAPIQNWLQLGKIDCGFGLAVLPSRNLVCTVRNRCLRE